LAADRPLFHPLRFHLYVPKRFSLAWPPSAFPPWFGGRGFRGSPQFGSVAALERTASATSHHKEDGSYPHGKSDFYGSILPTSLIYIVLSTRGCSPWRPDAVMSTTWHNRELLPRIFKDRHWRAGHHETCGALPASEPYLRMIRFQGLRAVKKKRELFPGPMPMSAGLLTLPSAAVSR